MALLLPFFRFQPKASLPHTCLRTPTLITDPPHMSASVDTPIKFNGGRVVGNVGRCHLHRPESPRKALWGPLAPCVSNSRGLKLMQTTPSCCSDTGTLCVTQGSPALWGRFRTAPIIALFIPGTPLHTTHLQKDA